VFVQSLSSSMTPRPPLGFGPVPARLLLAALALTVALMTAFAAPAHAARGMEVAVQDDHTLVWDGYIGRQAGLDRAAQMHVTWIRANVQWGFTLHRQARKATRPSNLVYDFSAYDALVDAAAAQGMHVQLSLTGPPPRWAAAGRAAGWVGSYKPSPREFGRFAAAISAHFRGRVTRYSVWNEPNWRNTLSPQQTAAKQYRALYLAAYSAIKATDPQAQVLFGELSPQSRRGWAISPLQFARDVLCVDARWHKRRGCATVRTDGVAQHAYEFSHAPNWRGIPADDVTIGTLDHLNRALTRFQKAGALRTPSGGRPPIYITEFGYRASGAKSQPASRRAAWVPRAFDIALRTANVRQLLQYKLVSTPNSSGDYGVMTKKGKPDAAFKALTAWAGRQARRSAISVPIITAPIAPQ
jgi:hypothetical protein